MTMRKAILEKHSALNSSQCSRHLKDFSDSYSQSPEPTSINLTFEDMKGTSIDLSIEMGEKCTIGSEKKTEILTAENCFRRIMDSKKGNAGKRRSPDSDEGIGSSFDSNSSSSTTKDNKESADCDSSQEKPELNNLLETETGYTKKNKASKCSMIKHMFTRPMRRHRSDDCSTNIPAHALFLCTDTNTNDTLESRKKHVSHCHPTLLRNMDDRKFQEERKIIKSCSSDDAKMASTGLTRKQNAKQRHITFKSIQKKFPFIRRWNNEDAIVRKTYSPVQVPITTCDQALQWSRSFDSLLSDRCGLELFKRFRNSEFSEENVEFWIACEEFRCSGDANMQLFAQKIYGDFVAFNAPKEVNLDSKTRAATISSLENLSKETFELAQHKIQVLMEKDSYPRFIESELYQQLLES